MSANAFLKMFKTIMTFGLICCAAGASANSIFGDFGGTNGTLEKRDFGVLNLAGTLNYSALITSAGVINLYSALGTGSSTITADAPINIYASQTLSSLTLGAGVEITYGERSPQGSYPVPDAGATLVLLGMAMSGMAWFPRNLAKATR